MKLIFFHHAGGDKYAFQLFEKQIQNRYQTFAYELPGRNYRLNEPLLNDMEKIIEDTYNTHKINIGTESDFVFIGLSMGALLAFLLTQKLQKENSILPKYIFLASRKSIEQYEHNPIVTNKNSEDFWESVKYFGANIDALLQHQELKEFYEPIVRNDFYCLEQFNRNYHAYQTPKIEVPVSVLYGNEDKSIDNIGANSWQKYCKNNIEVKEFDGGHFFLYNSQDAWQYIEEKIKSII